MSKRLQNQVLTQIRRHRLWEPNDVVTVAVSGGVDSMVLLHILVATQRSHQGLLQVMTFDHGLRTESADEVTFVQQLAEGWGIPCETYQLELEAGPNLQARARDARRAHLLATPGVIATGHHASDQAETVLFRMLRGSGLDGLQGLRPKYGRWVKPLLSLFKPVLVQYAIENELEWRDDPSNQGSTRGQIRKLWSHLAEVHPSPEKAMATAGTTLARDAAYLHETSEAAFQTVVEGNCLNILQLRQHHAAIQVRVIQQWLWLSGVEPSRNQLEDLLRWQPKKNAQRIQLSEQVYIQVDREQWLLCGG